MEFFYLLIVPIIISIYAQFKVKGTFAKYSKVQNSKGLTGYEVAKFLLDKNGIYDVSVERIKGNLTDHYDPTKKVIRLSDSVFNSKSIAAIGVAAHETGHAIQHNVSYGPLTLRHSIFPIVSISSNLAMPIIMFGLLFSSMPSLIYIGIGLFSFVVLFQLVTLPVEFNASSRALNILDEHNFINREELRPAKQVLDAAALTYVAAAISSIATLIRLILVSQSRN